MDPESENLTAAETAPRSAIRDLRESDREQWEKLWAGYIRFYRKQLSPEVTGLAFQRLCQNEDGMFGVVAENGKGRLLGFAHCVAHRSTWRDGWKCYLEDLYVEPSNRGQNVAEDLIAAAKHRSREMGGELLYWLTQPYNGAARSLYDQVGHLVSRVVYESKI